MTGRAYVGLPMRTRALPLLLVAGLLATVALAPPAAGWVKPRELQAAACGAVKIGSKTYVLYRQRVSCSYAKRWTRKVANSRGRTKPRGWKCTSGSKFRSGGYCQKGRKHFGWHPGD